MKQEFAYFQIWAFSPVLSVEDFAEGVTADDETGWILLGWFRYNVNLCIPALLYFGAVLEALTENGCAIYEWFSCEQIKSVEKDKLVIVGNNRH